MGFTPFKMFSGTKKPQPSIKDNHGFLCLYYGIQAVVGPPRAHWPPGNKLTTSKTHYLNTVGVYHYLGEFDYL